jgi:hypothetical protein
MYIYATAASGWCCRSQLTSRFQQISASFLAAATRAILALERLPDSLIEVGEWHVLMHELHGCFDQ